MVRVYGQNTGGYSFESTGKQSLKEAADSFIQNMWTQIKQIVTDSGKLINHLLKNGNVGQVLSLDVSVVVFLCVDLWRRLKKKLKDIYIHRE